MWRWGNLVRVACEVLDRECPLRVSFDEALSDGQNELVNAVVSVLADKSDFAAQFWARTRFLVVLFTPVEEAQS